MKDFCECCQLPLEECKVMRELRLYRTPEGRAQLRDEYGALVRARGAQRDANATPDETWHQAQKSGAPYAALKALKQGPNESAALAAAKEFADDREALFLLLLGPTGVGKTLAASLVVVHFCKHWPWNNQATGTDTHPVQYVDASTLTRLSAFASEDQDHVERLRNARLLVLEDAGDEGTELGKGVLVELLMHRHAHRRRTVITSNLLKEPFKKRYGQAVADRIRSTGIIPNLWGEKSRRPDKEPRP